MLNLLQIVVSIVLIVLILIQERSGGFSSIFGSGSGTPYQTRRGVEKTVFIGTIVSAALFFIFAVINLIL